MDKQPTVRMNETKRTCLQRKMSIIGNEDLDISIKIPFELNSICSGQPKHAISIKGIFWYIVACIRRVLPTNKKIKW